MHAVGEGLLPVQFPGGVLRRMRQSDLGAFQAYRSIPELGRFQGWSPMSDTQALSFLTEMESGPLFRPGQWVQLGIAASSASVLIGDIGLYVSRDGQSGEVGFTLAPSEQGRGIASAAVRQALELLFCSTAISRALGITDARNTASVRLLERLGFKCAETRKALFRGEECTELVYELQRNSG